MVYAMLEDSKALALTGFEINLSELLLQFLRDHLVDLIVCHKAFKHVCRSFVMLMRYAIMR